MDPDLNVIDGGTRRRSTQEDWEKAGGIFCSQCGGEVVRLIDGHCPRCHAEIEAEFAEKLADKSARRYYRRRLNEGTISLRQMKENHPGS